MRTHTSEVAEVLGIRPSPTPVRLIEALERGLPVRALDRVAGLIAPADANFKYLVIPKATLARRKGSHRLTRDESDRLARLAQVWRAAVDVWKSEDQARQFLMRPHMLLEGRTPVDVAMKTEIGARLVEEILGRLKYGSAA